MSQRLGLKEICDTNFLIEPDRVILRDASLNEECSDVNGRLWAFREREGASDPFCVAWGHDLNAALANAAVCGMLTEYEIPEDELRAPDDCGVVTAPGCNEITWIDDTAYNLDKVYGTALAMLVDQPIVSAIRIATAIGGGWDSA